MEPVGERTQGSDPGFLTESVHYTLYCLGPLAPRFHTRLCRWCGQRLKITERGAIHCTACDGV